MEAKEKRELAESIAEGIFEARKAATSKRKAAALKGSFEEAKNEYQQYVDGIIQGVEEVIDAVESVGKTIVSPERLSIRRRVYVRRQRGYERRVTTPVTRTRTANKLRRQGVRRDMSPRGKRRTTILTMPRGPVIAAEPPAPQEQEMEDA